MDTLYESAWFFGFFTAGLVHVLLSKVMKPGAKATAQP
jgi:cytosine/uracil/thiamine/allantoin permease